MPEVRQVAVVALIDRSGRIPMQHRTADAPIAPGLWTLPGGHLEPGENPATAAHRELREETGLTAQKLMLHRVLEQPASDYVPARYHVFTGATTADQSDVVLGEGQAMTFLTLDQITERDLTPIATALLPDLRNLVRVNASTPRPQPG